MSESLLQSTQIAYLNLKHCCHYCFFLSPFMLPLVIKSIHKNLFSTVSLIPEHFFLSTSNKCYSKQRNIKHSWNFHPPPLATRGYNSIRSVPPFPLEVPLCGVTQMAHGVNVWYSLYILCSLRWMNRDDCPINIYCWVGFQHYLGLLFYLYSLVWIEDLHLKYKVSSINVCLIGLVNNLVSWFLMVPAGSFEFYSLLFHDQQKTNVLYLLHKKLSYFFSRRSLLFCISTKQNKLMGIYILYFLIAFDVDSF